jgi:hypothetical protein
MTVTALDVGAAHNCVILTSTNIKCFGHGNNGKLGNGSVAELGKSSITMGNNLPTVNLDIAPVLTATPTRSSTKTPSKTLTRSKTKTPTKTLTRSKTKTPTKTLTRSKTKTPTKTLTRSRTATKIKTP